MARDELPVGKRVRITQSVDRREGAWSGDVIGTIVSVAAQKTGSWYAHGRDAKFWLQRIFLKKDDGELTTLTLDRSTRVEVLDGPAESS